MICAEAWSTKFIDKDLFPTMYRLMNNGFKFNNFYHPKGASSTSSGEYAFLTGMIPVNNDRSFIGSIGNNMGFTIPMKLKELGYKTAAFHNGRAEYYGRDETHGKHMGFDSYMANDTGLNDISKQRSTDDINMLKIMYDQVAGDTPFLAYAMTYNGHMPYACELSGKLKEYYYKVDDRYGNYYTDVVKTYIAKNLYLEDGLTYLLKKLEEDGLINDTVICMVTDHYPYGLVNANRILNNTIDYVYDYYKTENVLFEYTARDKTGLILWSGCLENEKKDMVKVVDKVSGTIDVTPTLLNLFA